MPNNTGPMTKDNMVELKPCPFCAASMAADDITKPPFPFSAVCPKCEAYGPGADSRAEAIAAWNTRATMHGSDSGVTEAMKAYAREASIELMIHAGGGSEMFKRIGDEWYADPALCRERIIGRMETARKIASRLSSASAPDSGALREALREALLDARIAIDSLDEDELGQHPELGHFYRDELLAKIDAALNLSSETGERE